MASTVARARTRAQRRGPRAADDARGRRGGRRGETAGRVEFTLLRLAGDDGHPRWRRTLTGARPSQYDEALAVDVDAAGDVVAAGTTEGPVVLQYHSTLDWVVVKLAGADGAERWRVLFDGTAHEGDVPVGIAVDPAGNVVTVGEVSDRDPASQTGYRWVTTAAKLAGRDGTVIWRTAIAGVSDPRGISLTPTGDLLIAASGFALAKLSGATGAMLWSTSLGTIPSTWEAAFGIAPLPSGDVATVGFLGDLDVSPSLVVAKVDGGTGVTRWQRSLQGTLGYGFGTSLAVLASGDLAVGGDLRNVGSCYDALVAHVSASTGEVLAERQLDGHAQASKCDANPCDEGPPPCDVPTAGIDRDSTSAVAVTPDGRVALVGSLSDGRRGRTHGYAGVVSMHP